MKTPDSNATDDAIKRGVLLMGTRAVDDKPGGARLAGRAPRRAMAVFGLLKRHASSGLYFGIWLFISRYYSRLDSL